MYQDISSLNPDAPRLDRREFFVTSILAGVFASAVSPIQAQTKITTDNKGLIASEVKITVADGEIPAYRAMPDKKGKSKSEIIVYPKADHGFHADYRPSYNKQASEDAWAKMLAWFKKHGAA